MCSGVREVKPFTALGRSVVWRNQNRKRVLETEGSHHCDGTQDSFSSIIHSFSRGDIISNSKTVYQIGLSAKRKSREGDRECVFLCCVRVIVLYRMAREGFPEKLSPTIGAEEVSPTHEFYSTYQVSSDCMKEGL